MLLLSIALVLPITPAAASPTTYVSVINRLTGNKYFNYSDTSPPPTSSSYPLGYLLVNITVTNVANLAGWQLNLTWNPAVLEIAVTTDLSLPADHILAGFDPIGPARVINNAEGWLYWAKAVGPDSPNPSFSGSGRIAQIKFNVTQVPPPDRISDLHFDLTSSFPTKLVTPPPIASISFTPWDGYYQYIVPLPPPPPTEGASLSVQPPEIINSSIVPPQTIQINITVKNATDMYGYKFSLSFNSDILTCISLTILDALGETNYIPEFSVNNTAGIIKVNVTYYPPAVPITTVPEVSLVKLIFRVKGRGVSVLDLYDTNLIDTLGRSIPHVVHDGLFVNLIRDLAVTNVVTNKTWAYQGQLVQINVTVRNEGEMVETSISVKAYYDSNLIDTMTIASLNQSEEKTITFDWDTSLATPCNNYTISAEVIPVPYELELGDNSFTDGKVKIRLLGDVNGDRVVDITDLVEVIGAIGSYPGYPTWNEYADLNGDNRVDIVDLVLTIGNFGRTC
jgi:hypothetical protein